jgi:hypothetical protein
MSDEERITRLKALNARDGGTCTEEASFVCPVCGVRPMLFTGNQKWNDGLPVVECLCLAPFSPIALVAAVPIWSFPWTRNAEAWGLFVQWKRSLPCDDDDDGDESQMELFT